MANITPINGYLLLRDIDETVTAGGIVLPEERAASKLKRATVVKVSSVEDYYVPVRNGDSDVVKYHDGSMLFKINVGNMDPDKINGYMEEVKNNMRSKNSVQPGDEVIYSVFGGEEVREGNERFVLCPLREVRAVIMK